MDAIWPAEQFNRDSAQVRRGWPLQGMYCRVSPELHGVRVEVQPEGPWRHPWFVSVAWHPFGPHESAQKKRDGEWRATVKPGFVNGRDAFMAMPRAWSGTHAPARDVPLTDDPVPWLALDGFRNPVASAGFVADESGQLQAQPGSGYPPFFASIGVRPPQLGGGFSSGGVPFPINRYDPQRTREIRAIDVVLAKPRLGTKLAFEDSAPLLDAQTETIAATFTNAFFASTGGKAKLRATAQYAPPDTQSTAALFGLLLADADNQVDELKIATVWMVSPPEWPADEEPDASWTPYAQHFVFWNLNHATRLVAPVAIDDPVRLTTGLPLADLLANPLLEPSNDQLAEMQALLFQTSNTGAFWT